MINLFIANTDNSWFDFLAAEAGLTEVNFWWPGAMAFRALQPGEMLVFRLKSPRNKIGGFGIFSSYSHLPVQIAWETFGRANGAATYESLRAAIAELREDKAAGPNTDIGCTVLVQPIFFSPDQWIELPDSWSRSIQRGKLYSTENEEGLRLWDRLESSAHKSSINLNPGIADKEIQARYGAPTLIERRLGQGAFRVAVTEAYGRQCAISDGKVLPALDAAHIKPYREGGPHIEPNGILLRKDIHSIFDAGYVTIDDHYRFTVSPKIKEVFNNGEEYIRLHGKPLRLPNQQTAWPDRDLLRWHKENIYLG